MASRLGAGRSLAGATIAFDLDGTLIDTAPDLVATLNVILEREGLNPLPLGAARPFIGRGAMWLMERGFTLAGSTFPEARKKDLFEAFIDYYLPHIADESRPYPGVVAALDALKGVGAKLVVCTNKRTDLSNAVLGALDLARFFEAVVGADMVPAQKPDPGHLITAITAGGGDIARAVMVGDAGTDAGAARAAGTPLVLVSFGYTETPVADLAADILIDHFDDLPDACARLLRA